MYVKNLLFQSKAEYHAGNQAQTDRKYGLKVVRYDVSKINDPLFNILMSSLNMITSMTLRQENIMSIPKKSFFDRSHMEV